MLFQTGYLTITGITEEGKYQLAIPNGEVLNALERYLFKELCTASSEAASMWRKKLHRCIVEDKAVKCRFEQLPVQ